MQSLWLSHTNSMRLSSHQQLHLNMLWIKRVRHFIRCLAFRGAWNGLARRVQEMPNLIFANVFFMKIYCILLKVKRHTVRGQHRMANDIIVIKAFWLFHNMSKHVRVIRETMILFMLMICFLRDSQYLHWNTRRTRIYTAQNWHKMIKTKT